jgi:hypothetical protein
MCHLQGTERKNKEHRDGELSDPKGRRREVKSWWSRRRRRRHKKFVERSKRRTKRSRRTRRIRGRGDLRLNRFRRELSTSSSVCRQESRERERRAKKEEGNESLT